jgi:predicted metal-dependent peptidase
MSDIDIRKELLRSIISVVRHKEFYGHVVQQFEKVFVSGDHRVQTAMVGRYPGERFIKLTYNEDYFQGLYDEFMSSSKDGFRMARLVASGATEHEILHVVFNHLCMHFDDSLRGGVAMDCVVNQEIPQERRHESWIMPTRYGLPNGKSSKWYYDNLKDNKKFNDDRRDGVFGPKGLLSWMVDSHGMWGGLDKDPVVREFIKDVIRKARDHTSAEGWGKVGSNIKEFVDGLLEWKAPQIPWSRVFRNFCASAEDSYLEYTISRESRRFGTRPGIRKHDRLRIAVIVDTSASIDAEQLRSFFNEVRWIWRNGASVCVFEADTDVKSSYEFRGSFTGDVHGRGGTNLENPLVQVDRMRFDCVVYFTDFQAPRISRRFRTPVMWVLSNPPPRESWPCEWGRAVEIVA